MTLTLRSFKPAGAALAAALALFTLSAHAEGLYVGGSIGAPHFGSTIDSINGGGSGASGKLFVGAQFNPNFAVEVGAADLGKVSDSTGTVRAHGEFVDAVGLLPLADSFSLLGSVGLAHANIDTSNGDDSGSGVKLGVGAEYAVSHNLSVRGEYENYHTAAFGGHPNIGQYTIGLRYGF